MMLRAALALVVGLALGDSLPAAERCTCMGLPTTCGSLAEAEAVFVATVVSSEVIRSSPDVWSTADPRVLVLKDVKPLRGRAASVIVTASSGSSCGYDFKHGVRYLIVAHAAADGRLWVSLCSQTRPLSEAKGLVAYLESPLPVSAPPPTRIWGHVRRAAKWNDFEREYTGVPGARVTFAGRTSHSVTAQSDGSYEIRTLPPGRYTVTVTPPLSLPQLGQPQAVEEIEVGVDKASACAELDFVAPIKSAISGVALDEQGQPRDKAFVQLRLPDQSDPSRGWAGAGYTTGPDGRFEFTDLPPGRYEIGFKAGGTIVTLTFGERKVLPPLVVR